MSLYRTWRPKSFADLVGQDAVVQTLRTALSCGKLAHAYLFSGPRGSGKTSAAKILARCIDCVHGPTPEPDNACEHCLAILAGNALDVIELDAASNRGIDEIRALRDSVKFAPAAMRAKVFIIDEAHMLTREGANAFLKTLEEPPPHAVFILATTAPEALPPTILSRCQRYAFRRIPVSVMIARMRAIAQAEAIAIDDAALAAIAYRADGGLRDGLTMLEQVAAYANAHAGGYVDAATVEAAFGATGRQFARALTRAILAGEAAHALRVIDEACDAGTDLLGLVRGTIGEYRSLLVARIEPDLLGRDLSPDDAAAAAALAAVTPQATVVRALRLLADALAAGRVSGNPRLELETAVLRLILQREDPNLDALAARVAALESGISEAPAVRSVAPVAWVAPQSPGPAAREPGARPGGAITPLVTDAPSVTPSAPLEPAGETRRTVTLQQARSLWEQIKLRAEEQHKPLRALLARATVDAIDGDALVLGVADTVTEGLVRDKLAILEESVAGVLQAALRVVITARAGAPRFTAARSGAQAASPGRPPGPEAPAAAQNGDIDLLAYARERIGGTEAI